MRYFKILLLLIWISVVFVTVMSIKNDGLAVAGEVFSNDVAALGWRAQFNMELLAYMTLMAVWLAWRKSFSIQGIVLGLLCFTVGVTFSALYVLWLTVHHKGEMRKIMMGNNA